MAMFMGQIFHVSDFVAEIFTRCVLNFSEKAWKYFWDFLSFPNIEMAQVVRKLEKKIGKIFTGPTYKLLLSFTVISDV